MHGLTNYYLYSAKKISVKFAKDADERYLQGTGFFIIKGDDAYLFTNRHLVEPEYYNKQYAGYEVQEFKIETFESFDDNGLPQNLKFVTIHNIDEFVFHPNYSNDIACLKNIKIEGESIGINAGISYDMVADTDWISKKLSICDTIAYTGFPEWYDRHNNTPIFRMGTIASDPRFNYSSNRGAPVADRIAYEGFSTGGSSGSPIFAVQRGFKLGKGLLANEGFYREVKLIGINAGHFPGKEGHSGISYFYKSSAIMEMIANK